MIDSKQTKRLETKWQYLVNGIPCTIKPNLPNQKEQTNKFISQQLDESNKPQDYEYTGDASFVSFRKKFPNCISSVLKNRELQLLLNNKPNPEYIPKDGLLFRRVNNAYTGIQIQLHTQLKPQKRQIKSQAEQQIKHLPKGWLIYSWLRLGFIKLSFQRFQHLFQKKLLLAKYRLYSHPNSKQNMYQNIAYSPLQYIKKSQQNENFSDLKCFELIDREQAYWNKFIFDRLPLSNGSEVYWPCVVLKSLTDPQNRLSDLKHKTVLRLHEDELGCFSQILQDIESQRLINKDRGVNTLKQELINLIKGQSQKHEQTEEDKYLVKLIGVDILLKDFVLPWKEQDERGLQLFKTKQKCICKELQKYIRSFNELKKLQQIPFSQGSQGRFCNYICHEHQNNFTAIILKCSQNNKNKVLIRRLDKKSQALRWTDIKSVYINLALPALNKWQISKYIDCRSIKENLDMIQRPYLKTQFVYNKQRILCLSCKYQIKPDHFIFKCEGCLESWHVECLNQSEYSFEKHDDSFKMNQFCYHCKPCQLCSFKLKEDRIKCSQCGDEYHSTCINLQLDKNYIPGSQDFVCYTCSKCKQCSRLVPLPQILQRKTTLCNDCFCQKKQSECSICKSKILNSHKHHICSYSLCHNTVHRSCDVFQPNDIHISHERYRCPSCRVLMRRQLLKVLVNELRKFDQMQYFFQPSFETIHNYQRIVDRPSCVMVINDRISGGIYDNQSLTTLKNDFRKVIENALSFNEVKSDPFYRAKVLYIIGDLFLQQVGQCIDVGDYELLTVNLYEVLQKKMFEFYYWLKKNYLAYLLNYSNVRSKFQIQYEEKVNEDQEQEQYEVFKFASSLMIRQQIKEGSYKLRFRFNTDRISALLTQVKTLTTVYQSLNQSTCYYHPDQKLPIIYQCELCWETYCCTSYCPKHRGKNIVSFKCNCSIQDPESELAELQIHAKKLGMSIEQVTQFYSKCFNCFEKYLASQLCYICENFCSYGYRQCRHCNRYFHIKCAVKQQKAHYQWYIQIKELETLCIKCWKAEQPHRFAELAMIRYQKLDIIKDYLPIFKCILQNEGLVLSDSAIIRMFYNRFDEVKQRECYLQFVFSNRDGQSMFELFGKYLRQKMYEEQKQLQDEIEQYFLIHSNKNAQRQTKCNSDNRWNASLFCQLKQNTSQEQTDQEDINEESTHQLLVNNGRQPFQKHSQKQCLYLNNSSQTENIFYSGFDHKILEEHSIPIRQNNYISILAQPTFKKQSTKSLPINDKKYNKETVGRTADYLRSFVLKIYKAQQRYLRKGNTYLIQFGQQRWCCVKKYMNNSYKFQISKENEQWYFAINDNAKTVNSVGQILKMIQTINPHISNMLSLVSFLGLNLNIDMPKTDTFSKILHLNVLQDLTRRQKKSLINQYLQQAQDNKTDGKGQLLKTMQANNCAITQRNEIFYLKKKNKQQQKQNNERNATQSKQTIITSLSNQHLSGKHALQTIKITDEEIRKDLGLVYQIDPHLELQLAAQPTLNCLYVSASKIDRLGLFTKQRIPSHTAVIEYVGELVSQPIADLRQKQYRKGCYMFALQASNDRFDVIDATINGNMARYLNHSCDANCRAIRVRKENELPRIIVYTIKQVHKNEQLTYDYQFKVQSKERIYCKCKSKSCQGRLN